MYSLYKNTTTGTKTEPKKTKRRNNECVLLFVSSRLVEPLLLRLSFFWCKALRLDKASLSLSPSPQLQHLGVGSGSNRRLNKIFLLTLAGTVVRAALAAERQLGAVCGFHCFYFLAPTHRCPPVEESARYG